MLHKAITLRVVWHGPGFVNVKALAYFSQEGRFNKALGESHFVRGLGIWGQVLESELCSADKADGPLCLLLVIPTV